MNKRNRRAKRSIPNITRSHFFGRNFQRDRKRHSMSHSMSISSSNTIATSSSPSAILRNSSKCECQFAISAGLLPIYWLGSTGSEEGNGGDARGEEGGRNHSSDPEISPGFKRLSDVTSFAKANGKESGVGNSFSWPLEHSACVLLLHRQSENVYS
jgi:hypothetical protein